MERADARTYGDVRVGWKESLSGGYGFGGAPAALHPGRMVPHIEKIAIADLPDGGYGGALGSSGDFTPFHNLAPRTRAERRRMMDKETLEKARLAQRREGFHRYEDPGRVAGADGPESASYMSEPDRFVRDVAGEEKLRREDMAARKAVEVLRRREDGVRREEERWRRMEEEKREEEERVQRLREDGSKAKKNKGSAPYDFMTLAYKETPDGERLKHADEMIRFRAAVRAQHLQAATRGQDFDVITGSDRTLMSLPSPPPPLPEGLGGAAAKGH